LTPRLVFGLAVMALGVGLLLENLGWVDFDRYIHLGPTLLIALGALKLWTARGAFGRWVGLLLLAAGGWILAYEMGYATLDVTKFWPLLLVLFGIHLVFRSRGGPAASGSELVNSAAEVYEFALLGGAGRVSNAPDFRGGEMMAFMGGGTLDLTQADIQGETAVIDVYVMWGGFEILVPSHWSVTCKGLPLLGGFVDSTRQPMGAPGPRLIVQGLAVMGGVDIKNPHPAPAAAMAPAATSPAPTTSGE
jgi:hypothetical protein